MFLNYETSTKKDYLRVLSWEAHLVMVAEMYKGMGKFTERREALQIKKSVSIQRKIMKSVLDKKEKATRAVTPVA